MHDDDARGEELLPVRVWDLPTRVFHWALAIAVCAAIVSANIGGNAMTWHFRFGYGVFALLVFRLLWGVFGGRWSRFRYFVYRPGATLRYLRGKSSTGEHHHVGHSPLGALSVFGLLAILAAQVATGLFADDEIAATGPLNGFVSNATGSRLTGWHKGPGHWAVYFLVGLHVAAIVYYLVRRRRNLIGPMLFGDKVLGRDVPASVDDPAARFKALALMILAGALVYGVVSLGG